AVEQLNAERVFQLDDRLGYGRLRDVEADCSLPDAAALDARHQNIKVAKLEATFDAVIPGHQKSHSKKAWDDPIIILFENDGARQPRRQVGRLNTNQGFASRRAANRWETPWTDGHS